MSSGVEISKRLVAINSVFTIGARLLSLSVLVWMHQYLLRNISAAEYAIYPVVASIISFAPMFLAVLTGSVARNVVAAYAQKDEWRVTQIVSSIMPLMALTALVLLAAGMAAAWFVGDWLTVNPSQLDDARLMFALFVFMQAFYVLMMPLSVGLYVRQKFVLINLIALGQELFRIILLFILLLGVSPKVLWVAVSMVAANFAGFLVTVILSRRAVPALRFLRAAHVWGLARNMVSFGGWIALGGVAYRIRTNADAIVLNEMAKPVDVAAFNVGALADRHLDILSVQATEPLQPVVTAMHSTGQDEQLRRTFLRGNRYYLWMMLLPAALLIAFGVPLTRLYVGETYIAAGTVMMLLFASYPFVYASGMTYRVALAAGRMRGFALAAVGVQIANLALTLYLVGGLGLGATGAALGTLVTASVLHVLVFWPLGLRIVGLSFSRFLRETLLPGTLPFAAALTACVGLAALKTPADWWTLFAFSSVGGVVYLATLAGLSLQPADRRDLAQVIARLQRFYRQAIYSETKG